MDRVVAYYVLLIFHGKKFTQNPRRSGVDMKKKIQVFSLALILVGLTVLNVSALPSINGSIEFSGSFTTDAPGSLSSATQFLSFSGVTVQGTPTGAYSVIPSGSEVTYTPFTFRPSLSPSPLEPLWEVEYEGVEYSFNATGVNIDSEIEFFIQLSGTGIAHIPNYDPTPGTWVLSATDFFGTLTFNATTVNATTAVPEPTSILLVTVGLLGLVGIGKKSKGRM